MPMLNTVDDLRALYGMPHERSMRKEIPFLNEDYQAFVAAAPFVVLATAGPDGLDCAPRGDLPGFVQVIDERTLAMPDRPGNNRLDSLCNVIEDPRVALLFMVPGVGEVLRVNGRARITSDADWLTRFPVDGKLPKTVLLVSVESAFFHCSKAVVRSKL